LTSKVSGTKNLGKRLRGRLRPNEPVKKGREGKPAENAKRGKKVKVPSKEEKDRHWVQGGRCEKKKTIWVYHHRVICTKETYEGIKSVEGGGEESPNCQVQSGQKSKTPTLPRNGFVPQGGEESVQSRTQKKEGG